MIDPWNLWCGCRVGAGMHSSSLSHQLPFRGSPMSALHYLHSWLSRDRTPPVLFCLAWLTPTVLLSPSNRAVGWANEAATPPHQLSPASATVCLCNILLILFLSDSPCVSRYLFREAYVGLFSLPLLIFQHGNECYSNIISPSFLTFLWDTILLTFTFGLVISLVLLEQVFKSLLLV